MCSCLAGVIPFGILECGRSPSSREFLGIAETLRNLARIRGLDKVCVCVCVCLLVYLLALWAQPDEVTAAHVPQLRIYRRQPARRFITSVDCVSSCMINNNLRSWDHLIYVGGNGEIIL